MRTLALLSLLSVSSAAATPSAKEQRAIAAYRALTPQQLEAKRVASVPAGTWHRLDVSEKRRAASAGHTTTLVVSAGEPQFYVEQGPAANTRGQVFGPFELKEEPRDAGVSTGPRCGPRTCGAGEVCCNPSCGICTPPEGFCTQQVCGASDGPQ